MSNQSELDPKNQEAINAALASNWERAASLNNKLLEEYPDEVDILNRLGKAYTELGQVNKARGVYQKVLEIDPYNPIATKSSERLTTLRGVDLKKKESRVLNPDIFLEELGKSKTLKVFDLALPKVLLPLSTGDSVRLNITKDGASVISEDNHRLGKLEDEWGEKIAQAASDGSEFSAIVKSVAVGKNPKDSTLAIFIKEEKRGEKLINPPFPIENNNFTPFVREDTINYFKTSDGLENEGEETETSENTSEHSEVEHPDDLEPMETFSDSEEEQNLG